ncbi:MAG: Gfo/Idh/MocA family oxidoreductase [Candidatus Latescibacteria bacterium]|jgi:predicted dehydrogenase|nr:Gfo/Idh/MocA family oxidoreductase [Candidatus Latescibacterota bacterium]
MAKRAAKKLRVAFIGAGGIAGTHMRYYNEMDDVEMVAMSDISKPGMARWADQYGIPEAYTDYDKMLKEIKPDAVSVCTPNGLHAPATIAALKAGAHVIVEKPLAMNAKEGQQMLAAAKRYKKKLVIGFQQRYDAKAQFLKNAVDKGQMGNVLFGRVQALRRRGIPNWGVFGRKDLQGGGPMIDIGVHALEVTHYVMGSPKPVAASGNIYTYMGNKPSNVQSQWPGWDHKSYTVEDLAVGQIRFENGATIHIESSFVAHIPKNLMTFQLMGEKGGGTWDPVQLFEDNNGYMVNTEPGWLPKTDIFQAKMRNFVDHTLYNKPTIAPAEHGLMVQKMLDGIYESAEKGKEVRIR